MRPLHHIDFTAINQPVLIVPTEQVVRQSNIGEVVSNPNECHYNALMNTHLLSQWGTTIEYVEGYAGNGVVEHAFNRAINDRAEYVYFDATTGASSEYYYALRAFSAERIIAVVNHYERTFLTFAHNFYIDIAPFPFSYDDKGDFVRETWERIEERCSRQKDVMGTLEGLNTKICHKYYDVPL